MTKDVQLVLGLALVGGIIYFAHKSANLQNESKSNFRGRSVRGRSGFFRKPKPITRVTAKEKCALQGGHWRAIRQHPRGGRCSGRTRKQAWL
jgi:hypothetical protein